MPDAVSEHVVAQHQADRDHDASVLSCLHTVASISRSHGGPSRTIPALCSALSVDDVRVGLVTLRHSPDDVPVDPTISHRAARQDFQCGMRAAISRFIQDQHTQLIHDHGLWLSSNHAVVSASRSLNCPLIISPRGMLEPWTLRYRMWKKRLAWLSYQKRDIKAANLLHATSQMENENLRRLGLRQPIAVIPNGVSIPDLPLSTVEDKPQRTALFLSRIHPKKGLMDLVSAWAKVRRTGWRLVIAGPDEAGYQSVVAAEVARQGLQESVEFIGSIDGQHKWRTLAAADLFVLPTLSENFGVVVAEALAAGVPVITTTAAPWHWLVDHQCGWWIPTGTDALCAALDDAIRLEPQQRRTMGQRGRQLVADRFAWPVIAQKMKQVYDWILHGGQRPEHILTD